MKRMITRIAALSLAVSAVAIAAETVTAPASVNVRGGKMSMSPIVTTVASGGSLTVLEKGDLWWQVQSGDTVGWVRKSDLDSGGNGIHTFLAGANAGANGSTAAGALSEGGASKGLNPGTEDYAKATGNDSSKLKRLQALRAKLINDGTYTKFAKQGKVGAK